jgi:hypothetical protein
MAFGRRRDHAQRVRRRVAQAVMALAAVATLSAASWWYAYDWSYVGSSRHVSLRWGCFNDIYWHDEAHGLSWWAGSNPVRQLPHAVAEGDRPTPTDGGYRATGVLHFDSHASATLRTDLGDTLTLLRESRFGTHHTFECVATHLK